MWSGVHRLGSEKCVQCLVIGAGAPWALGEQARERHERDHERERARGRDLDREWEHV